MTLDQDEFETDEDAGLGAGEDADAEISGELDEEHDAKPREPEQKPAPQDDDATEFSRRTQKRIAREVYKRKVLETELQSVRDRLEQFERSRQEEAISGKQSELNRLKQLRQEALSEGDTDKFSELDERYLNLRDELRSHPAPKQTPPQPHQAQPKLPEASQQWLATNSWYATDKSRAAVADKIASELLSEGYDYDDDFYEELDARMKRAPTGNKSPVRLPNRGGGTERPSGHGKITKDDLASMKRYGLDPNNAEHRKAWLESNA